MKRGAIYTLTAEDLDRLLHGGMAQSDIPDGADIVGVAVDSAEREPVLLVKVWHPSLPNVYEGEPYERRKIEVR